MEQLEEVTSSVELQEELQAFKRADGFWIEEIRNAINDVEAKVNILHRSREGAWGIVSDRVSATLNERMAEVERAVQTQSASPATSAEQNQATHEDTGRLDSRIEARFRPFLAKLMNSERGRLNLLKDKLGISRNGLEVKSLM